MVYVHQHNIVQKSTGIYHAVVKNQPKPAVTVQEKCDICDVMHHTAAITVDQLTYFNPLAATNRIYKAGDYNFVSIALVLAAGRAPPVSSYFC